MKLTMLNFQRLPGGRCAPMLTAAAVVVIFLLQAVVFADTSYEPVEGIRQQVQDFIDSHDFGSSLPVVSSVGKIDSRLRLQRCGEPLDIRFANDNFRPGRTFLGVSCHTGKPWSIYVTAKIELFAQVLVSTRSLLRGQTLGVEDVEFDTRKLSTLRTGYFSRIESLQGMQTTRTIGEGRVITASLLKPRYLVTRGQLVSLVATVGGIVVRMKGKALENATSNSRVKVKNISSGRIVEGSVVEEGIVKIPM
jgi:flagella basal body P-ring formation protein FlgA